MWVMYGDGNVFNFLVMTLIAQKLNDYKYKLAKYVIIMSLIFYVLSVGIRYAIYRSGDVNLSVDIPESSIYTSPGSKVVGDSVSLYVHSSEAYSCRIAKILNDTFHVYF